MDQQTEKQVSRPYKFSFDHRPVIEHDNLSEAILSAGEKCGACLFQSMSVTFRLDEFQEVDKAYKKLGKKEMSRRVFELCKKINQGQ